MRTSFGTILRTIDTSQQEATSTKVVAMPIDSAFTAETVTASVGHMPSTMTNTGFWRQMPSMNSSKVLTVGWLMMIFPSACPVAARCVATVPVPHR